MNPDNAISKSPKPETPKKGRPPRASSEATKPSITMTVDNDFVVVRIPRKDLTKKLLAELL